MIWEFGLKFLRLCGVREKKNSISNSNNNTTFLDITFSWIYSITGSFPVHFLILSYSPAPKIS